MFGHEVAVHDVDVDQIGAAALGQRDGVAQRGKIRRQQRRRDLDMPGWLHRLTSSEIGSPGAELEAALRALPQHDAGRHARDRDGRRRATTRKPRVPQEVGGAIAVDADQIRHDVGRAALAAVDEQRDTAPPLIFGGGFCATTLPAG